MGVPLPLLFNFLEPNRDLICFLDAPDDDDDSKCGDKAGVVAFAREGFLTVDFFPNRLDSLFPDFDVDRFPTDDVVNSVPNFRGVCFV